MLIFLWKQNTCFFINDVYTKWKSHLQDNLENRVPHTVILELFTVESMLKYESATYTLLKRKLVSFLAEKKEQNFMARRKNVVRIIYVFVLIMRVKEGDKETGNRVL